MKISEMITLLQCEQEKRGDVEVVLCGHYGETSDTFEVMADQPRIWYSHARAGNAQLQSSSLHIWTDIMTG